jgi:hypothetical protein
MVVIDTSISILWIMKSNSTLLAKNPGIHLFMVLYELSVFLETPAPQRKGRHGYIAASLLITALSALTGSLDMVNDFQTLFESTSPLHWRQLFATNFTEGRKYLLSYTAVTTHDHLQGYDRTLLH